MLGISGDQVAQVTTLAALFATLIVAGRKRKRTAVALGGLTAISFGLWVYVNQVGEKIAYMTAVAHEKLLPASDNDTLARITGQAPTLPTPIMGSGHTGVMNVFTVGGITVLVILTVWCLAFPLHPSALVDEQ